MLRLSSMPLSEIRPQLALARPRLGLRHIVLAYLSETLPLVDMDCESLDDTKNGLDFGQGVGCQP